MPDARRALGGQLPHVERGLHELVAGQAADRRQTGTSALARVERPVEPALAGDDDPLADVAQHRVARSLERPPRTRPRRAALLDPHDLAAQQHPQVVLQDGGDVGRQRSIRPATEVGDVDGDAAAGLEHAHALGEHVAQHLQVLEIRGRDVALTERLLVGLAGEVRRRRHHQRDRVGRARRPSTGHRPRRSDRPHPPVRWSRRPRPTVERTARRTPTRRGSRVSRRRSSTWKSRAYVRSRRDATNCRAPARAPSRIVRQSLRQTTPMKAKLGDLRKGAGIFLTLGALHALDGHVPALGMRQDPEPLGADRVDDLRGHLGGVDAASRRPRCRN